MIPKFKLFYKPFLEAFKDGEPHFLREASEYVRVYFNLSISEIRDTYNEKGTNQFRNRINWTASYMLTANMIERVSHGKYQITARGLDLLNKNYDLIDNYILCSFSEEFAKTHYKRKDKE